MPAPGPNTSSVSLWSILRNNIGKDLSKVAMPVELNEPLNTLQRLCEELEYSELLDKASRIPSPLERMVRTPPPARVSRAILSPEALGLVLIAPLKSWPSLRKYAVLPCLTVSSHRI